MTDGFAIDALILNDDQICAGLGIENTPDDNRELIAADTPEDLQDLVHYALAWGISDDGYRAQIIARATPELKRNLVMVINAREEQLDRWLAGPEAAGPKFTDAYIAFTALRMASDEVRPEI